VWQLFLSISPHLSGGTMATSQTCCHLPGELLNSAAECADSSNSHSRQPRKSCYMLPVDVATKYLFKNYFGDEKEQTHFVL
jgi:hypothetical protein